MSKKYSLAAKPIKHKFDLEAVMAFQEIGQTIWGNSWPFVRGLHAHLVQRPAECRSHAMLLPPKHKEFFNFIATKIIGPKYAKEMSWDEFSKSNKNELNQMLYVIVNDPPDILACLMEPPCPVVCIVSDKKVFYHRQLIQPT